MHRLRLALMAGVVAVAATLGFALNSFAASAPTATSAGPTAIGSTSATLNGTVNPNGAATEYAFEWGSNSAYDEETSLTSAGSGAASSAVSATISVAPGTKYYYRIIAMSASGTSVGSQESFTATGTKAAATTRPVTSTAGSSEVGTTTAIVSGSVNPEGQTTEYHFQYGTTPNLGFETADSSAGTGTGSVTASDTLTGLPSGTTIYYRLASENAGGATVGSTESFKTLTSAQPTTASASGVTSTGATLNGSVDPNGTTTSYYFQYGTNTTYGSQTTSTPGGNGSTTIPVNAGISGLSASTTYHYRLVAVNAAGTVYGADQTLTTSAATASKLTVDGQFGFVATGGPVVGVFVSCLNGSTSCTGTLELTHDVTIASRTFTLPPGGAGFVHLTLTAHGVHLLSANKPGDPLLVNARIPSAHVVHALHLVLWNEDGFKYTSGSSRT